jgi:hypothetical protein
MPTSKMEIISYLNAMFVGCTARYLVLLVKVIKRADYSLFGMQYYFAALHDWVRILQAKWE